MAMEKHHHHHRKEDGGGNALTAQKPTKGEDHLSLHDSLSLDPFDVFGALLQRPISLFSSFCTSGSPVDWKETSNNHIFKADLPGNTLFM